MTATIMVIVPQFIVGIVAFYNSSYVISRWHVFLLYQGLQTITLIYNIFALRWTPWTHNIGCLYYHIPITSIFRGLSSTSDVLMLHVLVFVSLISFFVISIACLVIAKPKQPSYYVWHTFINETGLKPDALVFLTGLVNPNYAFCALDGAVHLAEDCFDPERTVPRAICYSLAIGFVTAFFFTIAMLYCIKDIHAALLSRTGLVIVIRASVCKLIYEKRADN